MGRATVQRAIDELIAAGFLTLIEDNELRIGLATRANGFIRQFTWERAVSGLENCITNPTQATAASYSSGHPEDN